MQAVFFEGNRTLRLGESVPVAPGAGQVQIRVAYCGICGTDLHLFHGAMAQRLTLPHVMGHEMAGTVAAVGSGVADWCVGDRVTVRPLDPCGHCPACGAGHSHICHNLKFIGIDHDVFEPLLPRQNGREHDPVVVSERLRPEHRHAERMRCAAQPICAG